jgi:hypothetical protein
VHKNIPQDVESLRAEYHRYVGSYGKSSAVRAMATDYGCDPNTVRRRLAMAGIRTPRPAPDRPTGDVLKERVQAVSEQDGPRKVTGILAAEYGVTQATIRQWMADYGIRSMRPRVSPKPILEACPCGAVATTRYRGQDPALCFRCYMRTYAADKTTNFHRTAREYLAEIKQNAICHDCGGKFDPCVYHFDHVPERGPKLFNVSHCDVSIERLQAEIAKCDIVCANCHAVRTWKTRGQPWVRRGPRNPEPADEALF